MPETLNVEVAAKIYQELKDEKGFSSYSEVRVWLELLQGVQVSYTSIWRLCHLELKAKLKRSKCEV